MRTRQGKKKNRIISRIFTAVMLAALVIPLFPGGVSAEPGVPYISGTVEYEEKILPFYYSDTFFSQNAEELGWGLADVSLVFAMSTSEAERMKNLYRTTGFSEIRLNEGYLNPPEADTIGLIAGRKEITVNGEKETLVSVTVRGIGYLAEWAGNLLIGESGAHAGFQQASLQAEAFIREYLEEIPGGKPLRLWIQGYSRAGTVAYMTAKKLQDSGLLKPQHLYAYAFSAPEGASEESPEKNIHIIVSGMDYIQKILPSDWGLKRNGTTEVLGREEEIGSLKSVFTDDPDPVYGIRDPLSGEIEEEHFEVKRLDFQALISGEDEVIFPSQKHASDFDLDSFHSAFLEFMEGKRGKDVLETVSDIGFSFNVPAALQDRGVFARDYQEAVSYVVEFIFTLPEEKRENFLSDVMNHGKRIRNLSIAFFGDLLKPSQEYGSTIPEAKKLLSESGLPEEAGQLDEEKLASVLRLLGKLIRLDSDNREYTYLSTFIGNLPYIIKGHKPETLLAWIRYEHPEKRVTVRTESAQPMLGKVKGDRVAAAGTRVSVQALPSQYAAFDGWYVDGELFSKQPEYEFRLTADRTLTAAFHSRRVSSVTLDRKMAVLTAIGENVKLEASVTPEDALIPDVFYSSDHPDIVSVSEEGILTALREGEAVITVETKDGGFRDRCRVSVRLPEETSREEVPEESGETPEQTKPAESSSPEETSEESGTEAPSGEEVNPEQEQGTLWTKVLPFLPAPAAAILMAAYVWIRKAGKRKKQ